MIDSRRFYGFMKSQSWEKVGTDLVTSNERGYMVTVFSTTVSGC